MSLALISSGLFFAFLAQPPEAAGQEKTNPSKETVQFPVVTVPLLYRDPEYVAKVLKEQLGKKTQLKIIVSQKWTALYIQTDQETLQKVKAIVNRLEVPYYSHVIKLRNLNAQKTTKTINLLFELIPALRDDFRILTPIERMNAILIYSDENSFNVIRHAVKAVDDAVGSLMKK
jgi:hypothetical protein